MPPVAADLLSTADPAANMTALESFLNSSADVVLPAGVIVCRATPEQRYAIISTGGIIRSQGQTVIKLTGPQGGPGFDHWNYQIGLLKVAGISLDLEIKPGITLQVEGFDPDRYPVDSSN